jgi:DNA-binding GntR family transcriptional regulator
MEASTTRSIVDALTRAIVDHRLQPGSKLAEQKLADHFGVSRTLVRQALFQLAQNRLVTLEPARSCATWSFKALMRAALGRDDVTTRNELLGDFHVRMAQLLGNQVLAQILRELTSRCSLITLMYQSPSAAEHSQEEHSQIVKALAAGDEERAVQLMTEHLQHVEESLAFDRKVPSHDVALALS